MNQDRITGFLYLSVLVQFNVSAVQSMIADNYTVAIIYLVVSIISCFALDTLHEFEFIRFTYSARKSVEIYGIISAFILAFAMWQAIDPDFPLLFVAALLFLFLCSLFILLPLGIISAHVFMAIDFFINYKERVEEFIAEIRKEKLL